MVNRAGIILCKYHYTEFFLLLSPVMPQLSLASFLIFELLYYVHHVCVYSRRCQHGNNAVLSYVYRCIIAVTQQ